jgi:beta-glucanase (GH16 family)
MEKITWSGYEWRLQEEWGEYHPEHTYKWTDPSATQILANGCLDLMTQHNPKQFGDLTIPTGCGMVCSVQGFGWGSFEIEAKLPTGMNLWPAFWLSPLDQWPPEVDVFEGYSTRKPNYKKFDLLNPLKWYKLESNAFVSKPEPYTKIGAKRGYMFQDPTKKFIKYRVDWKPNKFEVFWNNIKVRTFEDKLLMEEFNQLKGRVRVLINTNVLREYNPSTKEKSHYLVKYFNFSNLDELIS